MPRPVLIVAAALALALAGCGDPAVQARYHPTTVDEVYGLGSHVSGVDGDVYELPASAPLANEVDLRTRACRPPGQVFKPMAMVALREDPHPQRTADPTPLAAWYEPGLPSPKPGKPYAMYGWQPAFERGAKESIRGPDYNPALEPGRSIYRGEPTPLGAWRRDTYSWCDEPANLR